MNILLVEDNEPEQVIMQEAFLKAGNGCRLWIAQDGFEALDFLQREGQFQAAPKPDLIILDLNLPKKNGREVLAEIRSNAVWEHLPILVLSNSESPQDICYCYAHQVNAYLNKPSDFQEFVDFAHVVNIFWLKQVRQCPH